MTPRPGSTEYLEPSKRETAASAKGEERFRRHLTIYLVTGLFLFTLNLLTSPGELWFYWPLFFWGWALVFQAIATFGSEAPTRVLAMLRSMLPWLPDTIQAPKLKGRAANVAAPFAAAEFVSVHERIERLKEIPWEIPEGPVRDQVLRICGVAENIVAVMAADRTDARTVGWFDSQLLEPTESLLTRYVHLASRGVDGAENTLRRVEERNLPLLASRFDALYGQLHRGEIVDLAVASEMLDFEPLAPPSPRLPNREPESHA